MKTITTEFVVKSGEGLRRRTLTAFLTKLSEFKSETRLECGVKSVNAKLLMEVLGCKIDMGQRIKITAKGDDCFEVIKAIESLDKYFVQA